jgi:hypothetical protein
MLMRSPAAAILTVLRTRRSVVPVVTPTPMPPTRVCALLARLRACLRGRGIAKHTAMKRKACDDQNFAHVVLAQGEVNILVF